MSAEKDDTRLSADECSLLDAWLRDFESAWDKGALVKTARDLPPGGPLRRVALIELIKIDMRRRWQRGKHPPLETYLKAFPELGAARTAPLELIQAEYEARMQAGAPARPAGVRQPVATRPEVPGPGHQRRHSSPPHAPMGAPGARGSRSTIRAWVAPGVVATTCLGTLLALVIVALAPTPPAPSPLTSDRQAPAPNPPEVRNAAPAGPAKDADYENTALAPVDERGVGMRLDTESEVDAAGDARTKLVLKMAPATHAFLRRMLTQRVLGGRPLEVPLRMKNLLDFMDLDAAGSILEDVDGTFGEDAIRLRMREVGFARHQDGRWTYALASDPAAPYELVKKERSRVVTVRSLQQVGPVQLLTRSVLTLPEGAHDIRVTGQPSRLTYRLPAPAATGSAGARQPSFRLEAKPHILSALYKLYGDGRFPRFWAARSAFRNTGGEALTDYRARFRIPGWSDWSDWCRSDFVYPGQTVVDAFRPAIDPKVQNLRTPTPAAIEAEYEYVRAGGEKVRDSRVVPTRLLGFNDGVYTDVKMDVDSPWCELLKGMPWLLASFTAGADPVMRQVAARARRAAGGASPRDGDQEAKRFLEALYNWMRRNVAYERAEGSVIDGVPSQYLKYGRDVLRTKQGTCINTAILYASVAEAAGLESSVVVVPQHAFMAIRLPKSRQLFFVETTGGTTTANAPFAVACARATETFQKAVASGLFFMVNIAELRAKGVTPPELPDVGEDALARWGIDPPPPDAAGGEAPADPDAAPLDRPAGRATIVDVRKEPDVVRGGLKGMAFHVHLKITGARGRPCEVFVICLRADSGPVRADLEGYSRGGYLMNLLTVAPRDDEAEWRDLVLFLPYKGIETGPGTHRFLAVIAVGSDGKLMTKEPTNVPFTLTRTR
jgi:hypothetical protein